MTRLVVGGLGSTPESSCPTASLPLTERTTTMSLLDRAFAAVYDPIMQASEVRGLSRMRAELLAPLSGTVVEIGAGTGLNLPHWPAAVDHVLSCEPAPEMADKLRAKVDDVRIEVVLAPGEAIPADDNSVDAVVSTLVLCTVHDVTATIREIARVLRPGGTLALIEHIAASAPGRARIQRVVEPVWKIAARGCHLTRDPRPILKAHGFDTTELVEDRMPGSAPIVERIIQGHSRAATTQK